MAKNPSHLTLVRKAGAQDSAGLSSGASTFEIVALSDLAVAEQKRVEKTVTALVPNAPIIGVQITARSWDIRPVVMATREGIPTLIRFVGPEVTLSTNIATRIQETFERISAFDNLAQASLMNEWGMYDGQLWYRRPVVELTLAQALSNGHFSELASALSLARIIVSRVEELHSRGVAHGHLSLNNIFYSPDGEIALLDTGVGLAVSQAALSLGLESSPRGYSRQDFAPETLNSETVVLGSDVYGLGVVLEGLFARFAEGVRASSAPNQRSRNQLAVLLDTFTQMQDENPAKRPSLAAVQELFGSRSTSSDETSAPGAMSFTGESVVSSGRIVKVRRTNQSSKVGTPIIPLDHLPPADATPSFTEPAPEQRRPQVSASKVEAGKIASGNVAADNSYADVVSTQQDLDVQSGNAKKLSNNALATVVGFALLVVAALFYMRLGTGGPEYSQQELELWWTSKRPSMMSTVALAAIDRDNPDKFAEMLVVSSAMRGDQVGAGVDGSLIRVAFDERWERDLKESDRRLALALALSALLREKTPRDLPSLESAHPGVILSITASAGDNVGAILDKIPASVLGELPPPVGPAFLELGRHTQDLTCGDETARSFARLATRGVDDTEQLLSFVSRDTAARLRAVAILYSTDSSDARRVLDVLLNHPNVQLNNDVIKWAKTWNLLGWEEMESSDQLALLGAIPPAGIISVQNLGKLFSHPQPGIRGFAIKKAVDQIKFSHPGAYTTLKVLSEKPELLNANQTVQLAQLLESNERATAETVRAWLDTKPPKEMVAALLISTSTQTRPTAIDFEFSRYLQNVGWDPKIKDLEKLISHPDNLTRFFAYTKAYAMTDKMVALELLKEALAKEQDPEFHKRLELMVASIGS